MEGGLDGWQQQVEGSDFGCCKEIINSERVYTHLITCSGWPYFPGAFQYYFRAFSLLFFFLDLYFNFVKEPLLENEADQPAMVLPCADQQLCRIYFLLILFGLIYFRLRLPTGYLFTVKLGVQYYLSYKSYLMCLDFLCVLENELFRHLTRIRIFLCCWQLHGLVFLLENS